MQTTEIILPAQTEMWSSQIQMASSTVDSPSDVDALSDSNGSSPTKNNSIDIASLVAKEELDGFSLDGYEVSLEDYWAYVYHKTERIYEWNNGILEEKPPILPGIRFRVQYPDPFPESVEGIGESFEQAHLRTLHERQRAEQVERRVAELEQALAERNALISRLYSYLSSLGLNLPRNLR